MEKGQLVSKYLLQVHYHRPQQKCTKFKVNDTKVEQASRPFVPLSAALVSHLRNDEFIQVVTMSTYRQSRLWQADF
jgi:hypothetical protein